MNVFVNVRPVSPPTKRLVPVGGLTINDSDCLEACITERLKFSSRLETSQPEMNAEFGSYSLSQARENLRVLDNVSKINVFLRISCLRLFKTHFFRVKLQTSLYHPIPLDSKPYKQTNRLENILLSLGTILLFFFSVFFSVFSRFYLFIYIYLYNFFERLSEIFQHFHFQILFTIRLEYS